MNIVFLSRKAFPEIGGVEKHTYEIKNRLEKEFDKILVIAEHNKQGSMGNNSLTTLNTGKQNWFKKFRVWKELWKKRNFLNEGDIIHCHDVFYWYLPFKLIYPKKPVYVTFHGYEGNNIPTMRAKIMHKIAEKFSNGNICVGDFLKKWYSTKPDYVIYGGVDVKRIKKNKLLKNSFCFIGRLEEETGILEYLKALRQLKSNKLSVKLDVYGEGSQREKAEKYVKENKLNVEFKGFIRNIEDVISKYEFVFVSRYLGILEALAAKRFVFAVYNNEIKKDYLEMAPFRDFISISNDSKSLSNEIKKYILNKEERDNKVEKGYKWVRKNTWDDVANVYLKLWGKR